MKTISFILILACAMQIALCERLDREIITPEGPVELEELVTIYMKYKYHRFDFVLPKTIALTKKWLTKVDEVLTNPDVTTTNAQLLRRLKSGLDTFLADMEDDKIVKKCSLLVLYEYYMERLRKFSDDIENEHFKDLLADLKEEYSNLATEPEISETDYTLYRYITGNKELRKEVNEYAKFRPVCCKYWWNTEPSMINGECSH